MQKGEILQEGVLIKDVLKVSLKHYLLSYCTLLILFLPQFILGYLGLLKTRGPIHTPPPSPCITFLLHCPMTMKYYMSVDRYLKNQIMSSKY